MFDFFSLEEKRIEAEIAAKLDMEKLAFSYSMKHSCAQRNDTCELHEYDFRITNNGKAIGKATEENDPTGTLVVELTKEIVFDDWVTRLDPDAIQGEKLQNDAGYRVRFSNMGRQAEFRFIIRSRGILASHPLLTYANVPFGGNCPPLGPYPRQECFSLTDREEVR